MFQVLLDIHKVRTVSLHFDLPLAGIRLSTPVYADDIALTNNSPASRQLFLKELTENSKEIGSKEYWFFY